VTGTGFGLSGTAAVTTHLRRQLTTTADITAKAVTGAFTASNKQYDGTTAASIISRSITGGVVGTETVTLTGGTATFGTKDVGIGKTVTGTGFTLGGGDASNYTLGSVPTATADITAKSLSGSFTTANKEYDGNRNATVASKSLPGVISGEAVTLNVSNPLFDTKDVGTNKDVTGSLSLSGADAGNYTVNGSYTAKADITAKGLSGSFTANDKAYDGTRAATAATKSLPGVVSGEAVTLNVSNPLFDSKDVGTYEDVTSLSLSGADAGNYTVNGSYTAKAEITAKGLFIVCGSDKVYDGVRDATVSSVAAGRSRS
jgi:hypothetical protein